ncbi:MAG: YbhB/YbcL family Raf kinase inhibitor-like protein, partial [Proteobacteria bacterium]|nr:YbhB/YbcL family Raf kinase inhibitor-like protein [Pseudomonadota bacterium]
QANTNALEGNRHALRPGNGSVAASNLPEGTKSIALIVDDPDAPGRTFVHWVLYNIPESTTSLDEGNAAYTSGLNDFGKEGYGGPMPPNGHGQHKYYFWVLALRDEIELDSGLSMGELLAQIEPRLIGMNRLIGTYQRD